MITLIILFFILRMMNPWRWHRPRGMFWGGPRMWHRPPMHGFGPHMWGPPPMGGFGSRGPGGFGRPGGGVGRF